MIAAAFFTWWYGQGWALVFKNIQRRLRQTSQMFSISILLKTLFSPWHRIVSYPGASIGDHMRAMTDNLVSRFVGFTVRIFVLIAAGISLLIVAVVAIIEIIAWPLVPLAIVAGIIKGLMP